jgi:hypothetical protein
MAFSAAHYRAALFEIVVAFRGSVDTALAGNPAVVAFAAEFFESNVHFFLFLFASNCC